MFSNHRLKSWAGGALSALLLLGATGGCDRAKATPGATVKVPAPKSKVVVPDEEPPRERTPEERLFVAMNNQNVGEVDKIVREHPELLNKLIGGQHPLYTACSKGSLPMVKVLVERGGDLKHVNAEKHGLLWAAVESDSVPLVKYLIERGLDPKGLHDTADTLLWAASSREMAKLLIDAGVDPKHKDALGDYAIHEACRFSRKEVVELLLEQGISVETVGRWNMRPLHVAACTGNGEPRPLVRFLLLDKKADVNAKGMDGHTALHECALFNRYEIADELFTYGAEVNAKDDDGRTPIDLAYLAGPSERALLINLLVRHGATKDGEPAKLIPIRKD